MIVRWTIPAVFVVAFVGCEGPVGSSGPEGLTGAPGADGEDGQDGKDGKGSAEPTWVLSSACGHCHPEHHKGWSNTGHASALTKVDGTKPADLPYSVFPPQPPTDDKGKTYGWTDVSYIIGGFGWKGVFADAKGYVVTGSKTGWNVKTKQWQEYEASVAPGTMTLGCASCHTTGYERADAHEKHKKQGDMEGAEGAWIEDGIGCERCHGKASPHVLAVGFAPITVNRSASMCGKCHGTTPPGPIKARDGLIEQGQQWNEMASTKMRILGCVDCHDPHRSAKHDDPVINPDKGIITKCETCHYKKVDKHAVTKHTQVNGAPNCVTCHMPRAVKSAVGNAAFWTGDLRSHLWRINSDVTAPQFSTDNKTVNPYLTINFACRQCHSDSSDKSDALLESFAKGYHD